MGFNFTLTEAAKAAGLDFFDLAGTSSMFSRLPLLDPLQGSATGLPATLTVAADGGKPYVLKIGLTFINNSGWYNATQYTVSNTQTGEVLLTGTGSLVSTNGNFVILWDGNTLLGGDDTITGNSGNNLLRGYAGINTVNGGAGTDTLLLPSPRANYTVTKSATSFVLQSGNATTTMTSIERLQFADQTVAYDTDGTAGQAYRLYQAAFNRAPDAAGLGVQVRALDKGTSLHDVAQNFINSAEFGNTYGSLSNSAFVTQLYANVLHRAPDAAGLAAWVGNLDHGTMGRADVLMGFSESTENQAALVGVIANGVVYV